MNKATENSRRKFMGHLALAAGATAGFSVLPKDILAAIHTADPKTFKDAEEWLKGIKGDHKVVYDATRHHDGYPFIWSWVFYLTNNKTGTQDEDMTSVVVMRHDAIPFAMKDSLWKKYGFGKIFNVTDSKTQKPSLRNLYYEPQDGDFPLPVVQGIKDQQQRGAMFCVCDMALTVYSAEVAKHMNLDPVKVKQEWVDGLLPGVQIVPSGVWALGRTQEHGCGYIFAG